MTRQATPLLVEIEKLIPFNRYMIVMAAFIILLVAIGGTSSFGIFFRPFLTEFGWTKPMTLSTISLGTILVGFAVMGAGIPSDRFGPKIMPIVGGLLLGLGYLAMSQISVLWQRYLFYWIIMGIGLTSAIIPPLSTIARWFEETRGTMTGIAMAGIGIGTIITPLLADWLIPSYGWDLGFIIIGIVLGLIDLSLSKTSSPSKLPMPLNFKSHSKTLGFSFFKTFKACSPV